MEQGGRKEAITILREGILRYPDSYLLMAQLADCLYCSNPTAEVQAEVSALLDRILSRCTDNAIRNKTIVLVCRHYLKIGRSEEALRLAESMEEAVSRLELLPDILHGRARLEAYRDSLFSHVNKCLSEMFFYSGLQEEDGSYFFSEEAHTSLLWKDSVDGGYQREAHNRSCYILKRFLADEDFAPLRGEAEFVTILNKLRKFAE